MSGHAANSAIIHGSMNLISRLANAGIDPGDSDDVKLSKSLLMFAVGLMNVAPMVWLAIYWGTGVKLSTSIPLGYQLVSTASLAIYLRNKNFQVFSFTQLGLFLFVPFIIQWTIGSFVAASGVILWGLLAPIGAVLCLGARESSPWFFAYILMVAMSAFFDYNLAEVKNLPAVPPQTSALFFGLNFIVMSTLVYILISFSQQEKERIRIALAETNSQLRVAQEQSERLLLNILPGPIAERLKQDDQTIADGFADITVMFADIVNFTQIAEGMSPNQIFAMLNQVFSCFDELAEEHRLEKIKTIGDAYMVAGGLNDDKINYSDAIANMALSMRDVLAEEFAKMKLEIRMGIGTGPVVAGVVGKKKFIYDLWGDTVNIASRITSESVPGSIQVDLTTYRRLRQRFDFGAPRTIYVKGKGDMTVYELLGRKAAEAD
jgi:class 3 adenylate cyclase